jgi:hypothetical protein
MKKLLFILLAVCLLWVPGQATELPGGVHGVSGVTGPSGLTGLSGLSGRSGLQCAISGVSGLSGLSGLSGISGLASTVVGPSGLSGLSGISGAPSSISGISGLSGLSGHSGISGISGVSGLSGLSGISGLSGLSGISGATGTGDVTTTVANVFTATQTMPKIVVSSYTQTVDITATGVTRIKQPYICISATTTQSIASTTAAQAVTFTNLESNGASLSWAIAHSTYVVCSLKGNYFVTYTAIANLTGGANQVVNMWLRLNDTDIARTMAQNSLLAANSPTPITATYLLNLNAGDKLAVIMNATSTAAQLLTTPAQTNPTRPISPAIRFTVNKASEQ